MLPISRTTSPLSSKGYGSEAAEQLLHPVLQSIFQKVSPPPSHILELGCGDGVSTRVLRKSFPRTDLTAIDRDPEALRAWYSHGFSHAKACCMEIDTQLPVSDGSIDLTAAVQVLMWLETASLQRALSSISKTLRTGGTFVATIVHPDWTERTRPALGERLPDGSQPYGASWHGKKLVHWWRSEQSYRDALEQVGITVATKTVKIPLLPPAHWHSRYTSRPGKDLYLVMHGTKN